MPLAPYLLPIVRHLFVTINTKFRFENQSFTSANQYRSRRRIGCITWIECNGRNFVVLKFVTFLWFGR